MPIKIPVSIELLADMETPLSVYKKLANKPYSYLFESVEGGEKWARYSLIGLPSKIVIRVFKNKVSITDNGKVIQEIITDDPLQFIEEYKTNINVRYNEELPKFVGGLVGYFGYDCIRYIEPKLKGREPIDLLGTPDALFMLSEEVAVFDNQTNKLHIIVLSASESKEDIGIAQKRLTSLSDKLSNPLSLNTKISKVV